MFNLQVVTFVQAFDDQSGFLAPADIELIMTLFKGIKGQLMILPRLNALLFPVSLFFFICTCFGLQ